MRRKQKYNYVVYHIPGIKVGCTADFTKRMSDQGFSNWQILWQEEGDYEYGWVAGDKEIEFQLEIFGKRDNLNHFQNARNNRPKFDGTQRTYNLTKENKSKGGITSSKIYMQKENTCPHCNKTIKGFNYYKWHGENCKHK